MYRVVVFVLLMDFSPVINIRDKKYLLKFGKNLRKLRDERGLTQEVLNNDAELGKNQVGNIERGEVNVTISTIKAIAKVLKIEPKDLLDF
jgi:transcriptional regulator with XRE-family HTH domain